MFFRGVTHSLRLLGSNVHLYGHLFFPSTMLRGLFLPFLNLVPNFAAAQLRRSFDAPFNAATHPDNGRGGDGSPFPLSGGLFTLFEVPCRMITFDWKTIMYLKGAAAPALTSIPCYCIRP